MEASSLEQVFTAYTLGKPEMDTRTLVKVFNECGILDKKFNKNAVDIIFSKVKTKGAKHIDVNQFEKAIEEAAKEKKISKSKLEEKILKNGGPTYTGTATDKVRLHDDKSCYTGVYARGGPSTVDKGRGDMVSDISEICDRSKADVRGVKIQ